MTRQSHGSRGRAAVLAPGGNYGTDGPLLMFAGCAAQRRGAQLYPVAWEFRDGVELADMVVARTSAVLDAVERETGAGGTAVLFGKSLGTLAAPVAAERGLAAVWFTPLLTEPEVIAALRETAHPFLLIGGTGDEWWRGDIARELTPHVVEISGADHGMFVPGPLAESAAVLGGVATAVERFLDDIVWPAR